MPHTFMGASVELDDDGCLARPLCVIWEDLQNVARSCLSLRRAVAFPQVVSIQEKLHQASGGFERVDPCEAVELMTGILKLVMILSCVSRFHKLRKRASQHPDEPIVWNTFTPIDDVALSGTISAPPDSQILPNLILHDFPGVHVDDPGPKTRKDLTKVAHLGCTQITLASKAENFSKSTCTTEKRNACHCWFQI